MTTAAWEGLSPPYSTIVVDPPWPYEGEMPINRGARAGQKMRFLPYSSMTVEEVAVLPVAELADDTTRLFLWTTNRYLEDAFRIVRAWGFRQSHTLVWCKEPVGVGLGGTFSVTTEFVLHARTAKSLEVGTGALIRQAREAAGISRRRLHQLVRGGEPTGIVYRWEENACLPTPEDWNRLREALPLLAEAPRPDPPHLKRMETTWWQWKRGPHSAKPPPFLDVVEQVSPSPYVELFARQPRLGWDSWGWGYEGVAS